MNNLHLFKQACKIAFFSVLFIASQTYGFTSYYVASNGSDSNDGKSTSTPWKTISKVNSSTYVSGDAIYFRAGDTFNGQINVNQSGVTLTNYGGSVKPIISGGVELTGWTVYSGSIYKAQASGLVKNLFLNGVQMTLARYPNTGFIKVTSTDGANTVAGSGLNQPSGYWTGGNVRIRTTQYTYETRPITGYNGSVATLQPHGSHWPDEDFSYGVHEGYGFYLDNKLAALDAPGEWYCDPSTNVVYFYAPSGANPSSQSVIGSIYDFGFNGTGSSVTVQGLDFRYQAHTAIRFSGTTSGNKVLSNSIFGVLNHGIRVEGTSSSYQIDGNSMVNVNGRGIFMWKSASSVISNNTIKNIGLVPGIGVDGEHGGTGILLTMGSTNNTIRGNMLDSLGYSGIQTMGFYNLVESNVIKNCMITLNDGGAIYNYNELEDSYAQTWRNNIVINVVGGGVESSNSSYLFVYGLYMDFKTHDMVLEGNTVVNVVNGSGLYMQYAASNNTMRRNTFYKCGENEMYLNTNANYAYGGNKIIGNILFSTSQVHNALYLIDLSPTYHPVGTFDSNYYCAPTPNFEIARVYTPSGSNVQDKLNLTQWRAVSGQDAHSKELYKSTASYERDTIVINETASTSTIALSPYLYHDITGAAVSVSVTLPPYSSRILIRDTVRVNIPLPVELVSFTVGSKNGAVVLNWKTATETNNYGFEIEKKQIVSTNGTNPQTATWNKIGFVAGSGTSNSAHDYSYTDASGSAGNYTYRLKQIDRDGQFAYSKEVELITTGVESNAIPSEYALGQNYPNPFNPSTNIAYDIASHARVLLKVYDVTGREVATLVNQEMEAGKYSVQWNAKDMPSGVYFYRLTAGNFTSVKKLLLQK